MLITTKEHYVMIKSAKMRTDRETKQSTKANTSSTNKSYYQDERSRLQQLIIMSMQNPKNMETYLTQFLDQKHPMSTSFQQNRTRVLSQPHLGNKITRFQKPLHNPYISRRQSHIPKVDTSPKSPTRTPSTNNRYLLYSFNGDYERKGTKTTPISKLSTSALIDYHKQLVLKAQKLIGSNKKKL
ncbi:unnamed protein product [Paramecium sonneborni]|uniref:Uncharacterized protein n=1 Tax=Paramecium sonneborni TaxID=65129 RepID=A0A8S1QZC0_9CILI|nr:unnamed protein product [Paramecium sonneborni]